MKWFILTIFGFISSISIAQNTQTPVSVSNEERSAEAVQSLDKDLSLSESQKESIKKIQLKFFSNLDKAKKNFMDKKGSDKSKAVKKMQSLNDQREKSIMKVLNPAQKEIFSKKIAASKGVKKEVLPSSAEKTLQNDSKK